MDTSTNSPSGRQPSRMLATYSGFNSFSSGTIPEITATFRLWNCGSDAITICRLSDLNIYALGHDVDEYATNRPWTLQPSDEKPAEQDSSSSVATQTDISKPAAAMLSSLVEDAYAIDPDSPISSVGDQEDDNNSVKTWSREDLVTIAPGATYRQTFPLFVIDPNNVIEGDIFEFISWPGLLVRSEILQHMTIGTWRPGTIDNLMEEQAKNGYLNWEDAALRISVVRYDEAEVVLPYIKGALKHDGNRRGDKRPRFFLTRMTTSS